MGKIVGFRSICIESTRKNIFISRRQKKLSLRLHRMIFLGEIARLWPGRRIIPTAFP